MYGGPLYAHTLSCRSVGSGMAICRETLRNYLDKVELGVR